MIRLILVTAMVALVLLAACAAKREPPPNATDGKEASAGDEHTHTRYRDLKSDPNWDSAEEAGAQLVGD